MSRIQQFIRDVSVSSDVVIDVSERALVAYSTDASLYRRRPMAVAFPRHEEDVCCIVEHAKKLDLPVLPRTAGTSLAGQAVNEAIVLDFTKHMHNILSIDSDQRRARVQPGVVLDHLNAKARPSGLGFGPDPASSNRAAMGGIVANNSTGSHSILYGMAADHVRSVRLVAEDGGAYAFHAMNASMRAQQERRSGVVGRVFSAMRNIENTAAEWETGMPKVWRRCGGYNFDIFSKQLSRHPAYRSSTWNPARVLCGSEGTLGVFSEIEVDLVALPAKKAIALLGFRDVHHALRSVPSLLAAKPSAIELIDQQCLQRCSVTHHYRKLLQSFCDEIPFCFLVVEVSGTTTQEVDAKLVEVQQLCRLNSLDCTVKFLKHPQQQANVWQVRKGGLGLVMSERTDFKPVPFIEDSAVPVEYLADYISSIESFCSSMQTSLVYYAHASAGCLHIRPMLNTKEVGEVEKLEVIATEAARLVKSFGGALSSEHGDGTSRSWLAKEFYGEAAYRAFSDLKYAFDPTNLFNPGNIVGAPHISENLRISPAYKVKPVRTGLNFNYDKGIDGAIEMCNGAAICRKETSGTMCPPFMVTRDEHQSTRGRANILREVFSGTTKLDVTSPEVFAAMDLCVQCKSCKSECPSSVDMAALKSEYLFQYYSSKRRPLLQKMLADSPRFLRSSFARNAVVQSLIRSRIGESVLEAVGVNTEKELPLPVSSGLFETRRPNSQQMQSGADVVLFADTFCATTEPQIVRSAQRLLEASGKTVHVLTGLCCGRTYVSKGDIATAKQLATELHSTLDEYADHGIPVVGLEPGCVSCVIDDFDQLINRSPRKYIIPIESFLLNECVDLLLELGSKEKSPESQIVFHGHCHQKALWGTEDTVELFARLGISIRELDAGCCGMAGSFGYEKQHADVSHRMGERVLFPEIRRTSKQDICMASGTSCRHQIAYGTEKEAEHPVVVLDRLLLS